MAQIKAWNGNEFAKPKAIHVWDGTQWVKKIGKVWDSVEWKDIISYFNYHPYLYLTSYGDVFSQDALVTTDNAGTVILKNYSDTGRYKIRVTEMQQYLFQDTNTNKIYCYRRDTNIDPSYDWVIDLAGKSTLRAIEVTHNNIWLLYADFIIEKYDLKGNLITSISIDSTIGSGPALLKVHLDGTIFIRYTQAGTNAYSIGAFDSATGVKIKSMHAATIINDYEVDEDKNIYYVAGDKYVYKTLWTTMNPYDIRQTALVAANWSQYADKISIGQNWVWVSGYGTSDSYAHYIGALNKSLSSSGQGVLVSGNYGSRDKVYVFPSNYDRYAFYYDGGGVYLFKMGSINDPSTITKVFISNPYWSTARLGEANEGMATPGRYCSYYDIWDEAKQI